MGWLPAAGFGKPAAGIVRRIALAGYPGPVDVEPYPHTRARLYPHENRSDREFFMRPAQWDAVERRYLRDLLKAGNDTRPFAFVDVGANIGLYTLSLVSDARVFKRRLRAVAVEPDPVNVARLLFNLAASQASMVTVAAVAAGRAPTQAVLVTKADNRGATSIRETAGGPVTVATLAGIAAQAAFDRIDAMKIDIEGHEAPALAQFFAEAAPTLHPAVLVAEVVHDRDHRIRKICEAAGYKMAYRNVFNAVFLKTDGR